MSEHHSPASGTYYLVFVGLIGLTGLTVGLSFVDLGVWHGVVGLLIATTKAILVIFVFMHVWYSTKLTWLVALSGVAWLAILIGLTLADYLTRGWSLY